MKSKLSARNRFYNPELGRFMQSDPIGFDAGDMNLFRYCGDDPVNRTDPDGRYARGPGFSDEEWKLVDQAQNRGAAALEKASAITSEALKSGKEAEEVKKAFEKAYGKGTATNKNLSAIVRTMKLMAGALRDSKERIAYRLTNADLGPKHLPAGTAGHALPSGKGIEVNVQHTSFTDRAELKWTMTHESGHNFGLKDIVAKENAVGFKSLPMVSPQHALENADTVVDYAFRQ